MKSIVIQEVLAGVESEIGKVYGSSLETVEEFVGPHPPDKTSTVYKCTKCGSLIEVCDAFDHLPALMDHARTHDAQRFCLSHGEWREVVGPGEDCYGREINRQRGRDERLKGKTPNGVIVMDGILVKKGVR